MAVAITNTATSTGGASSSSVITFSSISIGTASADRIVVIAFQYEENAGRDPVSATIDYGSGDTAMSAGTLAVLGNVGCQIFYLAAPTGTTATFKVTVTAAFDAGESAITVYAVTGADGTPASLGTDTSTDMDATDPLTTGSVTIPTDGGFIGFAACAAGGIAKTWANASEDTDIDVGLWRQTSASRTTAGTVTITVTGGTNGEDGALAWVIFDPATSNVTGTSEITLGAVTSASTGAAGASGTSAVSLNPVTTAASGTETFSATSAVTLPSVTTSGVGAAGASGESAVTLPAVTTEAAGAEQVIATSAVTLPAVTTAADGTHTESNDVTGTSAIILSSITTAASGEEQIAGTSEITLAAITFTADGTHTSTVTIAPTPDSGGWGRNEDEEEIGAITEAKLRKLLRLDEDGAPSEIEEAAEEIEAVAREIETTATYLPPPSRVLPILSAALKQTRALRTESRREALKHYRASVARLKEAIQRDEEEAELISLLSVLR